MVFDAMQRREFFQMAAAALWLPMAARPGLAALPANPLHDYLFFDERFPRARQLASGWARSGRPLGVQSDVTAAWNGGLDRMVRARPLLMRGVTVNSFLFCLKVLVSEHAVLDARELRLDRNLLHWSMYTAPTSRYGAQA
jgi:hypothetical protein